MSSPSECPTYDIKLHLMGKNQSCLKLWRIGSIPSLSLLQGSLCPGVVVPIRVSLIGKIELFYHLLRIIIISFLKLLGITYLVSWLSSLEMDTATRVQILDETDCISHSTNTLGKGMNPIILPPAMGK